MAFTVDKWLGTSRTFLFNAATALIAFGAWAGGQDWIAANPKLTSAIVGAVAVANIVLRIVTVAPVKLMP